LRIGDRDLFVKYSGVLSKQPRQLPAQLACGAQND
jgi:hypothetical protein